MKRAKFLKHLHQHGCKFEREGGRHTIYINVTGTRKAAVPRHPEIKSGTMRKICKELDIPSPSEQ